MSNERNIYQRIIEVQKKVTTVFKNENVELSKNSNENKKGYKAVSHDDVAALLHGPLADAGIVLLPTVEKYVFTEFEKTMKSNYANSPDYTQKWYKSEVDIKVEWINADKPEDRIVSKSAAFALDTSDKGFAKAYSLALKIALLKVHLLESKDEEEQRNFEGDGSPATHQSTPAKKSYPHKPQTNPQKKPQTPAGDYKGNQLDAQRQGIGKQINDAAAERKLSKAELQKIIDGQCGPGKKTTDLTVNEMEVVLSFVIAKPIPPKK